MIRLFSSIKSVMENGRHVHASQLLKRLELTIMAIVRYTLNRPSDRVSTA